MFSKAKTSKKADANAPTPAPAANAAPAPAPSKKAGGSRISGVPSIISADVVMRGNINSSGEVQFDGSLEGDIKASSLIVGEKASVKGEVVCETVIVRGSVEGAIRARTVSLAATSRISGDILHSSLSVETGAHFEGNCRHADDPLSDTSAKDFRRARPAAAAPATARPAPAAQPDNDSGEDDRGAKPPAFLNQSGARSPLR